VTDHTRVRGYLVIIRVKSTSARELDEVGFECAHLEKFSSTIEFSEMKERMKESLLELIKEGKLTFGEGVKVKIDGKEVKEN
jgi:RecB family endonuclease NucS